MIYENKTCNLSYYAFCIIFADDKRYHIADMNALVAQKLPELAVLCKKYRVVRMYLFGSAATDHFTDKSDIDILISFDKKISIKQYTDNYFELHYALEALFGREIDLLTENSLSNPYFIESVEKSKQLLYAS